MRSSSVAFLTVEAATMAPQTGYYDSLAAVAAAYCFGIAQSQAFLDGNKRTGVAVAGAKKKGITIHAALREAIRAWLEDAA